MNGRPDPERIPHLKREAHRIFAQYDPDPDNALYQHAKIGDLMVADYGGNCDGQEDDGSPSSSSET